MKSRKRYLILGLASVVIVSSFGITSVMADESNSIIAQIQELKNTLNTLTSKIETAIHDILGIETAISTQQSDVTTMKDTIAKQEKEIEVLKKEVDTIKSKLGTSDELVTIKVASFSKPYRPGEPGFEDSQWSILPMTNKQISIKNVNNPNETYTYMLDESGKCEIKIPVGTYMFYIPVGQLNTNPSKVTYIISPNVTDPKIAIAQYGTGTYPSASILSNLFSVMVQESSDTRETTVFNQF